ncbi:sucrose transporter [Aspergillus japonicus CBS 114.51]|uniref:Sucrose transporter n=2 Tax=Aspergillus TaxID=5052 RepID=A0A2V5GYX0_ASPV1|nr:sucrose transporter [Aspergillus japonicus CBS 114.51]PYI14572.1 sucrose transporter [Aspergillus violaceofuscus CBS 115571]RAH83034.1 sucrose transporter [Aspergillus japonicus CBS 114.51]
MPEHDHEAQPLIQDGRDEAGLDSSSLPTLQTQSDLLLEAPRSSWYLFVLTLGMSGLQIVWSVQHSSGSPYLLSLGMSKAMLAFVWIAGPLTGTIVQPYIGARSDNCRVAWGKRKPFMALGGAVLVFCLLTLAWVREIVGGTLNLFGVDAQSDGVRTTVLVVATLLMYCQDFAINTIQAATRAFIVDNAPAHQQESANAWASRHNGAGNILGYILGGMDLPKTFPALGNTQFKGLSVIASVFLAVTLSLSCAYIQEKDPRFEPLTSTRPGLPSLFRSIIDSVHGLSSRIRRIYLIQVPAWFAWFSFLFYATTYIGQLYVNPILDQHPDLPEEDVNKIWEDATRIGTLALLVNAIVSFAASIVLPHLVVSSEQTSRSSHHHQQPPNPPSTHSRSWSWSRLRSRFHIPTISGLTLRRAWVLSHFLFALCMFSTFLISTPAQASIMTGIIGISWTITSWAPWALLATEIARHQHDDNAHGSHPAARMTDPESTAATAQRPATPRKRPAPNQAGITLGLHNVAISLPQILSSAVSSLIFRALQKPRAEPWDTSTGWVMRLGGCAAVLAGLLTVGLAESKENI